MMKKGIIVVLVSILPLAGFSQSMFDKYEDLDNVSAVVVNESMFKLLSKINVEVDDKEAQDFMDIAQNLKNLKVFITEDKAVSADMLKTMEKYLKSSSLEELMRVKDKDANVKFYVKSGKDEDHVSELLMFVTGIKNAEVSINDRKIETVLLSLTGDIDLNKIGSLTQKMNLPQELNKAGKTKNRTFRVMGYFNAPLSLYTNNIKTREMKIKAHKLICLILVLAVLGCNTTQSLQQYYVDNAENPNFLSVDLPVSLLNLDKVELSSDQHEALKSLRKLNILAFKVTGNNRVDFQKEKSTVKEILKHSSLTELMKMRTSYGNATVNYMGEDDAIDEVVIYGDNDDKGFMLVRVLGEDMNPAKLVQFIQALQKSDYKGEGLGQLQEFIKG